MAGAAGIRAGRAFVELFADDSKLIRGLKAAEGKLKAWGASVTSIGSKIFAVGGGIVAAMAPAVAIFAQMGSELDDMSQRTGASVESLSSLGYAAQMSGSDMSTLEGGLRKMQQAIANAAGGSETAAEALAALGTSAADLQGLSPDEQFRRLADGIAAIQDPAKRTAAAMEVFGKSGSNLIPLMAGGSDAIRELEDRAKALGLVMSGDDAQNAAALGDAWDELLSIGKSLAKTIGAALAPSLITIAKSVIEVTSGVVRWMDQNRGLVVSIAAGAAAIAGIGATIVAVGLTLSGMGAVVAGFTAALAAIPTIVSGVGAVIAALVSPIGIAIAAVTALTAAVIYFSGAGSQIITFLQGVAEQVANVMGGVVAEITNGDFQGAWNIAMGSATVAIQRGMLNAKKIIYEAMNDIRKKIISTLSSAIPVSGPLAKLLNKGMSGATNAVFGGGSGKDVKDSFDTESAALKAAEESLQRVIDAAKQEASSRFSPTKPPTLSELDSSLPATGSGSAKQRAAGTFSADAAGRLGQSSVLINRIAKASEATAANTAEMKRKKGRAFDGD